MKLFTFFVLSIVATVLISNVEARRNYPQTLSGFRKGLHGTSSGDVILLDDRTIKITNFRYDGSAPDVFFWVGKGNRPNKDGRQLRDEKGSSDKLDGYEGKDIELELPNGVTVNDIDYLSVFCRRFATSFASVTIPKD